MSSFNSYLIGYVVLLVGLGVAAYLLNAPPLWIVVGEVVLLGLGIVRATTHTKPKDPPVA